MKKPTSIILKTTACAAAGMLCISSAAWAKPEKLPELSITDYEYVELEAYNDVHKHNVVIDEAVEPGILHTGLTEGSHCADCGEILTYQQVIPAKPLDRAIGYGCYGDDVLEVQQYLYDHGYLDVVPDGAFGWYTQTAVRAFQMDAGLDNPDGVVGFWSLEAMRSTEVYAQGTEVQDETAETTEETKAVSQNNNENRGKQKKLSENDIYAVQSKLYSLGYLGVEPTGYFGDMTRSALKGFQRDNDLDATGELDQLTLDKLSNAQGGESSQEESGNTQNASYYELYFGAVGDDVYNMQAKLQALGYLDEDPDGMFGGHTQGALEWFQEDNGLYVSGAGDTATLSLLDQLCGGASLAQENTEDQGVSEETLEEIEEAYHEITASNASLGQQIVNYAMQWVGVTPYLDYEDRFDEDGEFFNSLTDGTDCSGFVYLIYATFGIYLSAASNDYQYGVGVHISEDELLPGDIVVYRYGGHVGIYAGDGMLIHCSTPDSGTVYGSMWYQEPTAYVRVVF